MRKSISLFVAALAVAFAAPAAAQSAKNAAAVTKTAVVSRAVGVTAGGWENVFATALHTSQQKDVTIGVSFETGLFTSTMVASSKGRTSTSFSEAMIEVQVLVDGVAAAPGPVVFDKRRQTMIAQFGGILSSCTDANLDGTVTLDECTFTDETLELILDTMAAHTFNFVKANLGSGNHTVVVQARIVTDTGFDALNNAVAGATIGKGSVTVEEVRLTNNNSMDLL